MRLVVQARCSRGEPEGVAGEGPQPHHPALPRANPDLGPGRDAKRRIGRRRHDGLSRPADPDERLQAHREPGPALLARRVRLEAEYSAPARDSSSATSTTSPTSTPRRHPARTAVTCYKPPVYRRARTAALGESLLVPVESVPIGSSPFDLCRLQLMRTDHTTDTEGRSRRARPTASLAAGTSRPAEKVRASSYRTRGSRCHT